uniref:Uncharacterized protein n=1 Tax=candidate division WOR-3 bacterium TaxID=2052148 RepID=A0A7V3ZT77_UNCW3
MKNVEKMKRRTVYDAVKQSAKKNFDRLHLMTDKEFEQDMKRFREETLFWFRQLDPTITDDYEGFLKMVQIWNELVKEFSDEK